MENISHLLNTVSNKFKKAHMEYFKYIHGQIGIEPQIDNLIFWTKAEASKDFNEMKGYMYDFFESNNVIVSVHPHDIINKDDFASKKWAYNIWANGQEITVSDFISREQAELFVFKKAFQFVDTQLCIKYTKDRYYDQTADSSSLNMNWNHLSDVLNAKRQLDTNN